MSTHSSWRERGRARVRVARRQLESRAAALDSECLVVHRCQWFSVQRGAAAAASSTPQKSSTQRISSINPIAAWAHAPHPFVRLLDCILYQRTATNSSFSERRTARLVSLRSPQPRRPKSCCSIHIGQHYIEPRSNINPKNKASWRPIDTFGNWLNSIWPTICTSSTLVSRVDRDHNASRSRVILWSTKRKSVCEFRCCVRVFARILVSRLICSLLALRAVENARNAAVGAAINSHSSRKWHESAL